MATSTTRKRTTEQPKAQYGTKENPLSEHDALSLAYAELERMGCVLDDLAKSVRTLINLAMMDDDHEEYASTLRIYERVLYSEFDECSKVSGRVHDTLWSVKNGKGAASK